MDIHGWFRCGLQVTSKKHVKQKYSQFILIIGASFKPSFSNPFANLKPLCSLVWTGESLLLILQLRALRQMNKRLWIWCWSKMYIFYRVSQAFFWVLPKWMRFDKMNYANYSHRLGNFPMFCKHKNIKKKKQKLASLGTSKKKREKATLIELWKPNKACFI